MPCNTRYLLSLLDAGLAFAAAFFGLPASSMLWQLSGRSVPASLADLARISGAEWAILIALFVMPASLLGTATGYVLRRRGQKKLAVTTAPAVAFAASTLGLSAFYWWLSMVL